MGKAGEDGVRVGAIVAIDTCRLLQSLAISSRRLRGERYFYLFRPGDSPSPVQIGCAKSSPTGAWGNTTRKYARDDDEPNQRGRDGVSSRPAERRNPVRTPDHGDERVKNWFYMEKYRTQDILSLPTKTSSPSAFPRRGSDKTPPMLGVSSNRKGDTPLSTAGMFFSPAS